MWNDRRRPPRRTAGNCRGGSRDALFTPNRICKARQFYHRRANLRKPRPRALFDESLFRKNGLRRAVAEAAARRGAKVFLGKRTCKSGHASRRRACRCSYRRSNGGVPWSKYLPGSTIAIFAAAVADYRPAETQAEKMKRSKEPLTIRLEPTPDILAKPRKPKATGSSWVSLRRPIMSRKTREKS